MSNLSQFLPSGIKSIQSGIAWAYTTVGTNYDSRYLDIAIAGVNTAKSVIISNVSTFSSPGGNALTDACAVRFINSGTGLRVFVGGTYGPGGYNIAFFAGEWQVVEYY